MHKATIRARNDVSKVSIYCCDTRMEPRGDWPCGDPTYDQAMVVKLFFCHTCENHVKVVQPFKRYEVTGVKVNNLGEYTEGTMVDI